MAFAASGNSVGSTAPAVTAGIVTVTITNVQWALSALKGSVYLKIEANFPCPEPRVQSLQKPDETDHAEVLRLSGRDPLLKKREAATTWILTVAAVPHTVRGRLRTACVLANLPMGIRQPVKIRSPETPASILERASPGSYPLHYPDFPTGCSSVARQDTRKTIEDAEAAPRIS